MVKKYHRRASNQSLPKTSDVFGGIVVEIIWQDIELKCELQVNELR